MNRFLRKYSKWILAVGGTLLMVTFLVPQAIQRLAQQAGQGRTKWATVGGDEAESIRFQDIQSLRSELEVIERLGIDAGLGVDRDNKLAHWYLLTREAELAGLIGGPSTGRAMIEAIAAGSGQDGNVVLAQLARNDPRNQRVVLDALAKAQAVQELQKQFSWPFGAYNSDRRMKHTAARLFHAAKVRTVVINANADDIDYTPTESELQAQLDAYGDDRPGEGKHGFGYKLPDRAQLEWMMISANDVRSMIESSEDMSTKNLFKHWKRHEIDRDFPIYDIMSPIPDKVRDDLLNELAEQKLQEMAEFADRQLKMERRTLESTGGYLDLPSDWSSQRIALPDLAQSIQAQFRTPLPAYRTYGDLWLDESDLRELEDIGTAQSDEFGRPMTLSLLVSRAKEFGGAADAIVQAGVALPPLRNANGDVFIARILGTDPSRPPRTVDEARDDLVRDVKRKHYFESLSDSLPSIAAHARTAGMLNVAMQYDARINRPNDIGLVDPVYRIALNNPGLQLPSSIFGPSAIPGLGQHEETLEAIMNRVLDWPIGTSVDAMPADERIFVLPVEDTLSVVVVEVLDNQPLTQDVYDQLAGQAFMVQLIAIRETENLDEKIFEDAFGYAALVKRHNFKLVRDSDEETSDVDESATTVADTN